MKLEDYTQVRVRMTYNLIDCEYVHFAEDGKVLDKIHISAKAHKVSISEPKLFVSIYKDGSREDLDFSLNRESCEEIMKTINNINV